MNDDVRHPQNISIHALREEGDTGAAQAAAPFQNFYPRPPRGGRLLSPISKGHVALFLSTPSARRATGNYLGIRAGDCISIHALREEGDQTIDRLRREIEISIHALREEGDFPPAGKFRFLSDFYPRPPRGGRLSRSRSSWSGQGFLSTPSARRATGRYFGLYVADTYFYPRPPRGGRLATHPNMRDTGIFLSTPSARRATG